MTFPILAVFDVWALLILRIALGLIFVSHGLPKIRNLKKTAENFQMMGFHPGVFWGSLVAFTELGGGLALILGFFTQVAAFLIAIIMLTAIIWKIIKKNKFEKIEFDLILLAAAILIVVLGGGAYVLDVFLPSALI